MHVIQLMLQYDMINSVDEEKMLKDEPGKEILKENNETEWNEPDMKNDGKLTDISNLINHNLHD